MKNLENLNKVLDANNVSYYNSMDLIIELNSNVVCPLDALSEPCNIIRFDLSAPIEQGKNPVTIICNIVNYDLHIEDEDLNYCTIFIDSNSDTLTECEFKDTTTYDALFIFAKENDFQIQMNMA